MPRALSELSDTELQAVAGGLSPLEQLDDHELAGLAVEQGLMQPEEAQAAVVEKRRVERAPAAAGIIVGMQTAPVMPVPGPIAEMMLLRGGKAGDIAANVLTPIAGAVAGVPGGPGGVAAGGAAGGAAGDAFAQAREYFRGEGEGFRKGEFLTATAASAVPVGGPMLKTATRVIATRAVQGAAIAATADAVRQLIDDGKVDMASLATAGGLGLLFGAGAGTAESYATRRLVLKAIRRTPEFRDFKGSDRELVNAVRVKMNGAQPEPRNVTPEPGQPSAELPPKPAAPEGGTPVDSTIYPTAAAAAEGKPLKPLAELTDAELTAAADQSAAAVPAKTPAQMTDEELRAALKARPAAMRIPPLAELPPLSDAELATLSGQITDAAGKPAELPPAELTAGDEEPAVDVAPEKKGPSLRFGARSDGNVDIIDAIQELGGVPRAPQGAKGGEWDGHADVFRGPARLLLSKSTGGIDTFLQELSATYPEFAHLESDPDAFRATVVQALRDRAQLKQATAQERTMDMFHRAALEGKGRAFSEPKAGEPVPVDSINAGAEFELKGEHFEVVGINPDDGSVVVQDGPRFGRQILPAGSALHADKGTFKNGESSTDFFPEEPPANESQQSKTRLRPKDDATAAALEQNGYVRGEDGSYARPPARKEPWQMTAAEWNREREAIRPETFGSAPNKAPIGAEVARIRKLQELTYGVTDEARAKITAAQRGEIQMTPEEAQRFQERIDTPVLHRDVIEKAVREGKSVPPAVLADYPELGTPAPKSAAGQSDMFQGGETGGDTAFNLASETGKDFTGYMDERAAAAEAKRQQEAAQSDLFGAKSRSGAKASPGRAGDMPPPPEASGPNPPEDDPAFSQLPLQLPEMVQFFKTLSGGKYPAIVERIRVLHGTALGVFRYREGAIDSGRIELRADLFRLLSVQEKEKLLKDAVSWATLMRQANPDMNFSEAVRTRFHELVRAAEAEALKQDPRRAMDTFAHEIGHFVDFLPDATIKRGNILGRIASLHGYLKKFIAEHPGAGGPPTANERAKLRRQAEKELEADVKEIVETIRREEPVYKEIPITPEQITSILKNAQRDDFPDLYDWFAGLDRATKAEVLRKAMKGLVDERAAKFGGRVKVGTKIVEEEVRKKVGEAPTPAAIRKRYDELLRAELKRRGLISERDIRRELLDAIAWWQGVPETPEYFRTSEEMYAETFSILLNNPAALAKRAPTFYSAFRTYLMRKPAVKAAYEKLQDDIRSGAIQRQRVENLRDMFRADEEAGHRADVVASKIDWRAVRDTMRLLFDRQHGPIESRALRHLDSAAAQRVLGSLKDYLYRMTAVEAYARDLARTVEKPLAADNLTHNDLAEYMFHKRIAAGDRQELANPLGWSPNTSAQRLAEMERELGRERFATLEVAAGVNRSIYERHVVSLLERARILTPALLKTVKERAFYATFSKAREFNPHEQSTIEGLLEQSYGKDVTARIYQQIGTLGEVRSPYVATTQKAWSLIQLSYRQLALKALRDYLVQHEPTMIVEAETKFNGRTLEPRIVDTPRVGTLLVLDEGKVSGYYIPRQIYETMERGSPLESMIVGLAHSVLAWPKALLTELNPGFWPVAFAKDLATLGLQLPKGFRAWKQVPAAYRAAQATFSGKENAIADAALRRLMVISRADPRGEHLGHPDEMTRMLLRMGQDPRLWDSEAQRVSRAMRAFMWWKRQGQVLERTVKIAGMLHLDTEAFATTPEWQKKRFVNELAGSPDFLEHGRAASIVELAGGPIFYNAWLQGLRAFKRAAQNDPRGFWTKFLAFFGLPALAFYAFEKGLTNLGMDADDAEDHRDMLRSVPERDKLRGFVVPMGWADKSQGKVAYLVLPFPDQVRYLVAGVRKSAQTAGGDGAKGLGLGSFVQYQGQDLPGQNPMIAEAMKWWQFAALGQNPYDSFRGAPLLDPDAVKAGHGTAELAKSSVTNLTGGIVYRYRPDHPGDTPTKLETLLQLPMVGNLLGRWVRVSNAGLMEETDRITAPVQQHEAELRLVGEEMARKSLAGEGWSESENKLIQNEPYLVEYLMRRTEMLFKNATGPEMRAYNRATSQAQKLELLNAWAEREKQRAKRAPAK